MIFFQFIAEIVIFLLVLPFFLTLISFLFKKESIKEVSDEKSIACIITGYKNAEITIPCVESLISQDYSNFRVYLVLDNCNLNGSYTLSDPLIKILEPAQAINSKLKSIKYAIDNFESEHEFILIFDPDNLAPPGYLKKINNYAHSFDAVQTKRVAKNSSTVLARLDAIGEVYHNFNDKRNLFYLRGSATISGSGMLLKAEDFLKFYFSDKIQRRIDGVILGEDKMLQNFLVRNNVRIAFAEDILLFDEKVNTKVQVRRQRIRWLNTYFENISESFLLIRQGLWRRSWNQVLFGLYSLYPPLFLVFLTGTALLLLSFFIATNLTLWLAMGLIVFFVNFVLALYFSKAPKNYYLAILHIPFFILQQIYSLFHLNKAKEDFLVTGSHESVTIEEVQDDKTKN